MAESLVWTRSDGLVLDLNDGTNYKLRHHDGFGMPSMSMATIDSPGIDGSFWLGTRMTQRTITLELTLCPSGATSLAELQSRREELIAALNPFFSGTLTLTQTNGKTVNVDCTLAESLTMPTAQHIAQKAMNVTVRLVSTGNPFLYETDYQELIINLSVGNAQFPFQFPFVLSQSGVFAEPTVNNAGQVTTPVEITLTGPATTLSLTHVDQGREISFVGSALVVSDGTDLVVNTDPRNQSVTLDGVDSWQYLTVGEFWQLLPGGNKLRIDLAGATPDTEMALRWRNRYMGI